MRLRMIPRAIVDQVLQMPQQIVPERPPRRAYQSHVALAGGKTMLIRVIVDEGVDPPMVVTVNRTS